MASNFTLFTEKKRKKTEKKKQEQKKIKQNKTAV